MSQGKTIKEGLKSILTFEGASGIMHVLEERIFSFDTVIKQVAGDKFIRIPGNLDTP